MIFIFIKMCSCILYKIKIIKKKTFSVCLKMKFIYKCSSHIESLFFVIHTQKGFTRINIFKYKNLIHASLALLYLQESAESSNERFIWILLNLLLQFYTGVNIIGHCHITISILIPWCCSAAAAAATFTCARFIEKCFSYVYFFRTPSSLIFISVCIRNNVNAYGEKFFFYVHLHVFYTSFIIYLRSSRIRRFFFIYLFANRELVKRALIFTAILCDHKLMNCVHAQLFCVISINFRFISCGFNF